MLKFTKTSGLSHFLNQPHENIPLFSFLVEGTKVWKEGRSMRLKKKKKNSQPNEKTRFEETGSRMTMQTR